MKKKKYIERFTLQFNPQNALHKETIELLNQLGQKKADYIAKLIHDSKMHETNQIQRPEKEIQKQNPVNDAAPQNYKNEILEGLKFF